MCCSGSSTNGAYCDFEPLCAAQETLLMVHTLISNAMASLGDSYKKDLDKEECQILVPASQSENIIGKSGSTIKKLRGKTRTNIRVTSKDASDPTYSCAMHFDKFIQFGPKEDISLDTTVPDVPPSIIIPSDVPVYPAAGLVPGLDSIVNLRSLPSILGATHVPEYSHYADTGHTWPVYSSSVPVVSGYGGASRSEELILKVLCSSSKNGRVIGKGGGSIKSVRHTSGARVDVDDKKTDNNDYHHHHFYRDASHVIDLVINSSIWEKTIYIRCKWIEIVSVSHWLLVKLVARDALVQIVLGLQNDVLRDKEGNRNPSDGVGLGSL
ncbi:hypothetical protein AgCh_017821 [Apium graveolens]